MMTAIVAWVVKGQMDVDIIEDVLLDGREDGGREEVRGVWTRFKQKYVDQIVGPDFSFISQTLQGISFREDVATLPQAQDPNNGNNNPNQPNNARNQPVLQIGKWEGRRRTSGSPPALKSVRSTDGRYGPDSHFTNTDNQGYAALYHLPWRPKRNNKSFEPQ